MKTILVLSWMKVPETDGEKVIPDLQEFKSTCLLKLNPIESEIETVKGCSGEKK